MEETIEKKNKWLEEDKLCPSCGQVIERSRGITKQNMKRLFKPQWNATEMTINILLVGILLLAFLYNGETSQAREYVELMENGEFCKQLDLASVQATTAWQKQDSTQLPVDSGDINWSQIITDYETDNRTQSVSIRT